MTYPYNGAHPGQPGWPPPPGAHASLNPPDMQSVMAGGAKRTPIQYPQPPVPTSPNVGIQPRDRPIDDLVNVGANVATPLTTQFDIPSCVYAITASAVRTDGTAFPTSCLDPRDAFQIRIEYTGTGDQFVTNTVLGSTICGTASQPRFIGGVGWLVNRGTSLMTTVTPLFENLRISVVYWTCEFRGMQNWTV